MRFVQDIGHIRLIGDTLLKHLSESFIRFGKRSVALAGVVIGVLWHWK